MSDELKVNNTNSMYFLIILGALMIVSPFNQTLLQYVTKAVFWIMVVGMFVHVLDTIIFDKKPEIFNTIFSMTIMLLIYSSTTYEWLRFFPMLVGLLFFYQAFRDLKSIKKIEPTLNGEEFTHLKTIFFDSNDSIKIDIYENEKNSLFVICIIKPLSFYTRPVKEINETFECLFYAITEFSKLFKKEPMFRIMMIDDPIEQKDKENN